MHRIMMSIVVALFALLVAGPVAAKTLPSDQLIREVPKDTKLVVGVDVKKVSQSFLFAELMKLLDTQKSKMGKSIMSFALESGAFDFNKDVEGMLIAFEEPMMNPQATTTPKSAVVLSGSFDKAKVKAAAEKHFGKLESSKKSGVEVLSGSGLEVGFADANTLIIADRGSYADRTWAAAADDKLSAAKSADLAQMMKLIDTRQGIWVAMVTKGVSPPSNAPQSPAMDGAALAMSLTSGASVDFLSQFAKKEDAAGAMKQFEELKAQSGQNPMVAMLGAQPLMNNLKASVIKDRVLKMSTSMSDAELRSMYAKLKQMSQAPPPMVAPPASPNPGTPTPGAVPGKPASKSPAGGANADFN